MGWAPRRDLVMTCWRRARLLAYRHPILIPLILDFICGRYLILAHCCGRAIYRNGCAENQPGVGTAC